MKFPEYKSFRLWQLLIELSELMLRKQMDVFCL
jgi:hypothetical protein